MRVLLLGGTVFLGRQIAAAALEAGHDLTLFNRGRSNPGLFPQATHLTGDREGDLGALASGEWELVIDTSGFVPRDVLAGARLLADRAERYVFISSASVFSGWPATPGIGDASPVHDCAADAGPEAGDYGTLKAGSERAVRAAFGAQRSLVARAGLLVGPHEHIGRLPAWLERAARGGPLVAPDPPGRPLQLLDARDLAAWTLEPGRSGCFITVGETLTMADLVAVLPGAPEPAWVEDAALVLGGVEPWVELPFWLPHDQFPGAMALDGRAAGLRTRPLAETVADTWRWLEDEGGRAVVRAARPPRGGAVLLDAERERALAARAVPRRDGG
jgi:nucleoside-diphosphate-sugar epimerase